MNHKIEIIKAGPAEGFRAGSYDGRYPQTRLAILLNGGFFAPEFMINPTELGGNKTAAIAETNVESSNYSYAMLEIDTPGRRREWAETANPDAAVLSDRLVGSLADPYSVWTSPGSGWEGTVVMNDGSATRRLVGPVLQDTRYGNGDFVANDHLFTPDDQDAGGYDDTNAAMIYADVDDYENQK